MRKAMFVFILVLIAVAFALVVQADAALDPPPHEFWCAAWNTPPASGGFEGCVFLSPVTCPGCAEVPPGTETPEPPPPVVR